jgi:diguanylate cyclase (GGDEF)-like protein/PAS domain S-box-containing protein
MYNMKNPANKRNRIIASALKNSELRYRRLFEAAQDGILILDAATGAITDVNPYLIEMLGYSREEFLEKKLWEVGAFKDTGASKEAFEALQKDNYIRYKDLPLKAKDGRLVEVEFVSNVYRVGDEKVIQCNIRNITDRVQAEKALKESEARYRRLFEAAQDGILILDAATGMINDVNPFLVEMLGYSRAEFVEKKLWEVGAFKDVEASKFAFQVLQKNEYIRYEDLPLKAKSGKLLQVEFVSNVYGVGDQKVIQCNIRDITERKQAQDDLVESEALLREQSVRDHLTGLFNRRYMEETMERELLRASRKQSSIGIIMLDVDGFKMFNDTYGHAAGDAVLRELGALLLGHVRGEDIACRYGGDEFIIILPDASLKITSERAHRLCDHARHFPVQFEGQTLGSITLSLGVAVFPENGSTTDEVLRAVDMALYRAKRDGSDLIVTAEKNVSDLSVFLERRPIDRRKKGNGKL